MPDGKNGTRIEYPSGTSEPLEAYSGLVWFLHHFNHYFGKFTLEEYCNHRHNKERGQGVPWAIGAIEL